MLHLLFIIVYVYLVLSTLYLLVLAIAGRSAKGRTMIFNPVKRRIAVLIPAYKEDTIIVDTAERAADHNYSPGFFQVVIIADSLKKETLEKLRNVPVKVLEVQFNLSTKAKSLHAALQYVKMDDPEIVVVLDADNVMESNCLEKINAAFHNNIEAVQCHRTAKNQDTAIARLEAISEEININLFRRGPATIGLSAKPSGSGMAFRFGTISNIFETTDILENPAEDREIEIQLMKRNIKMEFLDDVFVYDEKVSDAAVFQKQRVRWLEAQLNQILRFFKNDMKNTRKTADYYHIFFQSLLLPRLLYLVIYFVIIVLYTIHRIFKISFFYPSYSWWLTLLITYFFILIISVPLRFYNTKTLKAVGYLPVLMMSMIQAVLKLKRNRKEFLHTPKTFGNKL